MATAQDAYKELIRDFLSPHLRSLGFKGSGGAYEFPSESHWVIVGVQASQFSSARAVKFTLNCQVVRRDRYDEVRRERTHLGPKPKPNTMAGGFVWHRRIGKVMPQGEDYWWSLEPTDNLEDLAWEVSSAVRDYLLPAIQAEVAATAGG